MPSVFQDEYKSSEKSHEKATFGMGCFWACDSLFGATVGVFRTRVGYSGGTTANPTYRNIGDHTEVVEIEYDPAVVKYETLLEIFWKNHEYDVTSKIKTQYKSLILYHNEEQKIIAEKSLIQESTKYENGLTTILRPASEFYPAEDYHQKYRLQRHSWILEAIDLKPEYLQTSFVATKLNGYLAGVGTFQQFESDISKMQLSDRVKDFVRGELQKNYGGSLYC